MGTVRWRWSMAAVVVWAVTLVVAGALPMAAHASVPPIVMQDPSDAARAVGQAATFVAVTDRYDTARWERSTDGGTTWSEVIGTTAFRLDIEAVTLAMDGHRFRAVFVTDGVALTTRAATLTVYAVPTITTHPAPLLVVAGGTATFTAAATGSPTLSYQWQRSTDGGATWSNLSGRTSPTLSLTSVTSSSIGLYRVRAYHAYGQAFSNGAQLNVGTPPAGTQTVTTVTELAGTVRTVTASITAGSPFPTVAWEESLDGGTTWAPTTLSFTVQQTWFSNSTTLTVPVADELHGRRYRPRLTNTWGEAILPSFLLRVGAAPVITTNASPTTRAMYDGQPLEIVTAATGTPTPTVQWYRAPAGAAGQPIEGATEPTLSTTFESAHSGSRYYAIYTNRVTTAQTATVTVSEALAPTFTTPPTNLSVGVGETARITVAVAGAPAPSLAYQRSNDGGATWTTLSTTTSTSYTIATSATYDLDGGQYRVVATNVNGSATSDPIVLTVRPEPVILDQADDEKSTIGGSVSFVAKAGGHPAPTVQWQRSLDGGATWADVPGATSTTLTFATPLSLHESQYRAVFTNVAGTAITRAGTLRVGVPTLELAEVQPYYDPLSAGPTGLRATFSVSVTGSPAPSIEWYRLRPACPGCTYKVKEVVGTGPTLSYAPSDDGYGWAYYVSASNSLGLDIANWGVILAEDPAVSLHPTSNVTVAAGGLVQLSARASGKPLPNGRWEQSLDGGQTWSPASVTASQSTVQSLTHLSASFPARQGTTRYRAVFESVAGTAISGSTVVVGTAVDTGPEVTLSVSSSAPFAAGAYGGPVTIAVDAVDPDGIASLRYELVGAHEQAPSVLSGSSVLLDRAGTTTVRVWAVDGLGNASPPGEVSVRIAEVLTAPRSLVVVGSSGSVALSWSAPVQGDPLVGYVVTPYVGAVAQEPVLVGTETSVTVSGLVDGTAYSFRVAGRNARGTGPVATSKVVVPGVASPPTGLKVSGGAGSVSLSWTPAVSPSAVVGHVVTPFRAGVAQAPRSFGPGPSAVVTGLDDGVSYTFQVAAVNAAGVGAPVTSKSVVPGAPGLVSGVKVTSGAGSVSVSWTAGVSPAGPVVGHVITPYIGSVAQPSQSFGPGTSAVVTGLVDGTTYTLRVAAVNVAGPGPAVSSKPVVPGVPSAPTGLRATAGEGSVSLSWTAAVSPAGPVLQHVVTPYVGSVAQAPRVFGPGTTAVVTGLVDGTGYTFKVAAVNVAGTGAQVTSARVTPGAPGAPTGQRASVPVAGTARATWDVGSPSASVTGYRVTPVVDGVVQAAIVVGMVGQFDLSGLAVGTRVTFRIQAVNAYGAGPNAITGRVTV